MRAPTFPPTVPYASNPSSAASTASTTFSFFPRRFFDTFSCLSSPIPFFAFDVPQTLPQSVQRPPSPATFLPLRPKPDTINVPRRPRPTHRGCFDPPLFPSVTMGSRRRFHHRREDARIPSLLPMVAHSRRLSHTIPVRLSPSRSSASRQPKIARWHTIGPPLNAVRVSLQPLSHLAQSVETGRAVLAAKGTPLSILGRSLFLGHSLANGFPATARTGAFSHARLSACSGKVGSRCA